MGIAGALCLRIFWMESTQWAYRGIMRITTIVFLLVQSRNMIEASYDFHLEFRYEYPKR
jgi:hypothetical protein